MTTADSVLKGTLWPSNSFCLQGPCSVVRRARIMSSKIAYTSSAFVYYFENDSTFAGEIMEMYLMDQN